MHFVDRKAKYPGRWTMKKSDGSSEIVTLIRNDEPIVEGTPMNAETLNTLSDVAGAEVARIEATKQAQSAAASADAAARSQTAAATSAQAAQTSAGEANASAEKAAEEARKAENYVAADKTLSIPGAPADAATVGNIILDRTKEPPQPIFYAKSEVDKLLEDCKEAAKRAALLAANPVGKLWVSDDPTSPASIVGGTWERIENCTIWGASSLHPAGTKLEAGLPNITGRLSTRALKSVYKVGIFLDQENGALKSIAVDSAEEFYNSISTEDGTSIYGGSVSIDASRSNSIYGASDTVQPPAYCMYIWRRVA